MFTVCIVFGDRCLYENSSLEACAMLYFVCQKYVACFKQRGVTGRRFYILIVEVGSLAHSQ